MAKTKEELLIEKYGLNFGSYKYVLPGSEILKYIGQTVMCVNYKKVDGNWKSSYAPAVLESISNFDPVSMTYVCRYRLIEGEHAIKEVRIIPEGYSWGEPEKTEEMIRLVPYSIHAIMVEDETFFARVEQLYNTRPTLTLKEVEVIARSKDRDAILRYAHNIGMAVKLNEGGFLWVRIHKINVIHKRGTQFNLRIETDGRSWSFLVDSTSTEFDFEGIGTFKILDLASDDVEISESTTPTDQMAEAVSDVLTELADTIPVEESTVKEE